jgi:exopolysaccharide production protein ExoZ
VSRKILWLEAGRGVASLAVGLVHAGSAMKGSQYSGQEGLGGLFHYGFLGVDFFFVLSGFIIMHAYASQNSQPVSVKNYLVQRFFRILPAYWVCLVGFLLINQFQRDRAEISWSFIFSQVTLTTSSIPWLGVAWTLQYEFIFYLVFCFYIVNQRIGAKVFLLWFVAILAYSIQIDPKLTMYEATWVDRIFSAQNLEFLFGMLVAKFGIDARPKVRLFMCLLILFFVSTTVVYLLKIEVNANMNLWRSLAVGSAFALVVLGLVNINAIKFVPYRWLTWLGKVSFSFYLVHTHLIGYFYALCVKLGVYSKLPESILILIACLIALFASELVYRLIEKPAISIGRNLVSPALKT